MNFFSPVGPSFRPIFDVKKKVSKKGKKYDTRNFSKLTIESA